MNLDGFSPTAPARVRALVLPIGPVRQSKFSGFVQRLQRENIVRLGDVSPDGRPNRTMFSPLAFPDGLVHYDISRSFPSTTHLELAPFEIYRLPLLIIGIIDGSELPNEHHEAQTDEERDADNTELVDGLSQDLIHLQQGYPSALAHHILIFDFVDTVKKLPQNVTVIPPIAKSRTTTIKTVMCDMTSVLLAEMAPYAKSLQERDTIETPKSGTSIIPNGVASALPSHMARAGRPMSVAVRSRSQSPVVDDKRSHRMSMPAHTLSNPDSGASTPNVLPKSPPFRPRTPPVMSDDKKLASATSPQRNSSDRTQRQSTERLPAHGIGERDRTRGKARVGVIIGAMYLLAGRWPDAMRELSNSAAKTRTSSDYAWQAKAMDYLLVCLIMCAYAGMDFRIPDVLRPVSEHLSAGSGKSSKHSPSNSQHEITLTKSVNVEKQVATLQSLAALVPDLVHNILNLYTRAYTFTDDKIPRLSFSQSTIRFSKLLTVLFHSGAQLNESVLHQLVVGHKLPHDVSSSTELVNLRRPEIVTLLLRAHPGAEAESSLSTADRIAILIAISSVLSDLKQNRKMVLILKDVFATLLPSLVQARKDGAAEMGVHPAASLASLNLSIAASSPDSVQTVRDDTQQGFQSFLNLVCQQVGVHIAPQHGEREPQDKKMELELHSIGSTAGIGPPLKQAILNACGAPELKVDILRACINVCEALPDLAGVFKFSAMILRSAGSCVAPEPEPKISDAAPNIAIEDQVRLSNNMSRTLGAAQHLRLQNFEADYWDDFLVRGIDYTEGNQAYQLTSHEKSEIEVVESMELKKEKDPFIFNPFLKAKETVKLPVLVAGEEAAFSVVLQNLFDIELVIDSLILIADDTPLSCHPHAVVLGPYRMQPVIVSAVPTKSGSMAIAGCRAKVRGCRERFFSIFSSPWALPYDVKGRTLRAPDLQHISDLSKRSSQNSISNSTKQAIAPRPSLLTLKVMERQPVLVLKSMSLPQSAVMLEEGERKAFSITIHNISRVAAADLVLVSFTDSTLTAMQDKLANKSIPASELYELELSIAHQPALHLSRSGDMRDLFIAPGGDLTLNVEVLGKTGLIDGIIQINYSFLGVPRSDAEERFFTRQIAVPITVTVNPALSLIRTEILPLYIEVEGTPRGESLTATGKPKDHEPHQIFVKRMPALKSPEPHCLLLLEFHNFSPSPLLLRLDASAHSSDQTPTVTENSISASDTIRIPVPIPRKYLPSSSRHAPIPSLNPANKRQYVVSATQTSPSAEREAREAFWYREAIVKRLHAIWKDESDNRTGSIDLRTNFQMTSQMVSAYMLEDVTISMRAQLAPQPAFEDSDDDEQVQARQIDANRFEVPTDTFLTLQTTIHNRSPSSIPPSILRLQPALANQPQEIALDLTRKLLASGLLQRPLPEIEGGGEVKVDTGFVVLAKGLYEWSASVEEIPLDRRREEADQSIRRARAGTGDLDAMFEDAGRRRWSTERPCMIIAKTEDL